MAVDTHFHPLKVRSVRPETDEAMVVSFDIPAELGDRFRFTQGQYLTLRQRIAGEELRRSYSICAGIDDGELRVGDTIDVMPPQGRFFVDIEPTTARNYLCVAGGSGITPMISIMKTVLANEPGSRVTLVYGNRRAASTMFKEELEDLKNRYVTRVSLHHVFSEERVDSPLNQGVLDRAKLGEFLQHLIVADHIDHAFICGPFMMNDEAEAALLAAGVAQERIHVERFGVPIPADSGMGVQAAPAQAAAPGDAPHCHLTVVRDGVTHEIDYREADNNLLESCANAGLDVPYSCKSGVCGTCRAHLDSGDVRMARNYALEKRDLEAGFILTCQAHPTTAAVRISFDHR